MSKIVYGWHFTASTLRDGRPIPPPGEWLVHEGEVVPCKIGLHLSEHPLDALQYAIGTRLHFVGLTGDLVPHGTPKTDKWVGRSRVILASGDVTDTLWEFARLRAVSVLHLWKAPPAVAEYLKTGRQDLRAARASAWAAVAAGDSAGAAARKELLDLVINLPEFQQAKEMFNGRIPQG